MNARTTDDLSGKHKISKELSHKGKVSYLIIMSFISIEIAIYAQNQARLLNLWKN
jgi:hypothetical protein